MTTSDVLEIAELRLARDGRDILRGVTLAVTPGEVCVLMGRSGAGKSTILRVAAALQAFDAGSITLGDFTLRPGAVPRESALKPLRRKVGMVFQSHALFEHISALENVALAPIHALKTSPAEAQSKARVLLEQMGVAERAHALPRHLSGGEAQRVAIARALAVNPTFLFMDEPTASLDPERRGSLSSILTDLAARGRGLLIATHDLAFARSVATSVVTLENGVLIR